MNNSMKQTVIKNPGWWHRRTGMERGLTWALVLAIIGVCGMTSFMAWYMVQSNNSTVQHTLPPLPSALAGKNVSELKAKGNKEAKVKDICLTPECVHTASQVLKYMDPKVEPCDDFYGYACGQYMRTTNIPDDKTGVNVFTIISDELQQQLRTIIEDPMNHTDSKPVKLTKKLYKACMNKTLIEERGLDHMKQILKDLGGWPVLEGKEWNPATFDWKSIIYRLRQVGQSVDYFIDFSVFTDAKNSTHRSISLDTASLGLSREYLVKGFDHKIVKAYHDYQIDISVIYGADPERAKKEMKEALEFETALANISLPSEKRRNSSLLYNPMTIDEMQRKFPSIPWIEYINNILPTEVQVNNDEVVIVSVPSYITDLEQLLAQTEKRIQANYVFWRVASSVVSYMNQQLKSRALKYSTILTGKLTQEPRWKECTDIVSNGISLSVGSLYVKKFFNEGAKQAALDMVTDIQHTFRDMLSKVDWMDEKTRERGLAKAKSMTVHIAYPDELLDDKKLDEFYDNLELDENKYLESILNLTKFGGDYAFARLRKPVNKTEWITHGRPAIVNAYYSAIENSIQFPAGILQGSFFSSERPKYMNYGAIGFVIGHEITHGFDDQGRQFDNNGNLVDWWEPETKEKFLKKARCIIEQYGNFTEPLTGLKLNGINTQGENIADNGGIKEAYLAYTGWTERQGAPEPRLPGLDHLSPQQMFWVAAAQTWCTKHREEAMRQRITTGVHSPGQFRVLGPLSNMKDFAQDFSCPAGSKMNPVNKCQVW